MILKLIFIFIFMSMFLYIYIFKMMRIILESWNMYNHQWSTINILAWDTSQAGCKKPELAVEICTAGTTIELYGGNVSSKPHCRQSNMQHLRSGRRFFHANSCWGCKNPRLQHNSLASSEWEASMNVYWIERRSLFWGMICYHKPSFCGVHEAWSSSEAAFIYHFWRIYYEVLLRYIHV